MFFYFLIKTLIYFGISLQSLANTPIITDPDHFRDFYKSPISAFRSGQAPYEELIKKRSSAQTIKLTLVEIGKYQEWIPTSYLYTIHDFQYTTLSPMSAYTKVNAIIYKKINGKWTPTERIKKGSPFLVEQMTAGWACGEHNKAYACLANDQIVMAIDFAKKITTRDGKVFDITERREDQLTTTKNSKILWKDIKEWTPDYDVALVKSLPLMASQGKLTAFERVTMKEHKLQYWVESIDPKHGKIWWQLKKSPAITEDSSLILSTNEIKSRGIFDWSTNKNSLALVSAQGIFISQEKDTWKYVSRFGEVNHPVAVGFGNTLFVGDQVSLDGGQNFEPYIRWDILSSLILEELGRPPEYIKINKIYIPNEKQKNVYVQIETGQGEFTFSTNLKNQSLKIVR